MHRVIIAEDRATMRNTLRHLLTVYGNLDVCGEAEDGQQAVDAAIALKARPCSVGFQDAERRRTQGRI